MSETAHASTVRKTKGERQRSVRHRGVTGAPANSATLSREPSSIEEAFMTYYEVRDAVTDEIDRVRSLLTTLNLTLR